MTENVKTEVFSSPSCGGCKDTKAFLTKRGISFIEHDVTADSAAMERIVAMGYRTLPVVVHGDKHWGGHRMSNLMSIPR